MLIWECVTAGGERLCVFSDGQNMYRVECGPEDKAMLQSREAGCLIGELIMSRLAMMGLTNEATPESDRWS